MTAPRESFSLSDGLLFGLGVLGFVLFAVLLPDQHPDAAADYRLGEEEVREAATDFLVANGYRVDGLEPTVVFRRQNDLLDSLQQDLGRRRAVETLQAAEGEHLPGYYWYVRWYGDDLEADEAGVRRRIFSVSLDGDGDVWAFARSRDTRPGINRQAVAYALLQEEAPVEASPTLPPTVTDSLLAASLFFLEADTLWRRTAAPTLGTTAPRDLLPLLENGRERPARIGLGPNVAVRMARYHLRQTLLGGYDLRVDSLWLVRRQGPPSVRVRFQSETPQLGQTVHTEVEVNAQGGLLDLDTRYNAPPGYRAEPPEETEEMRVGVFSSSGGPPDSSDDGVGDLVEVLSYVGLLLFFLVLFFRRLNARVVDAQSAMRDAFLGGIFLVAMIILVAGRGIFESAPSFWTGIAITAIGALMAGAGGAFLIFVVSSSADSVGRETWPEKLEGLSLARLLLFRNMPVGWGLVRGVALSGVLLGAITLTLLVLPGAVLHLPEQFMHEVVFSPAGFAVSSYGWYSLFLGLLVPLGMGTLLYRWVPRAALVVPGLVLLFFLFQVGPGVTLVDHTWVLSGVVGTVLALAFWRYDFLTFFFGYFFMGLLWDTAPGWLIDGFAERLDAALTAGLAVFALGVGLVGILSRRTGEESGRYVPSYVQELAHEERLKRELEIAYQVQESFLPRRMPRLEGLDLAAMCLAAQEVGGDYYDFVELGPGRLGVVVGDVSGKGIQAAFYMTLAKGFFQTLARDVASPAEVLRRLNGLFYDNAVRGTFISMIYGVVDLEERTFTFARAGHNPVILKRSPSQEPELVQPAGIAIGLTTGALFDRSIEEETVHLRGGDVLVFYTDGFSEAMNMAKEQFGDERLARKVSQVGQRTANEILRAVSEEVHHFVEAAGRHDDMTMVVLKLTGRSGFRPS